MDMEVDLPFHFGMDGWRERVQILHDILEESRVMRQKALNYILSVFLNIVIIGVICSVLI